MNYRKKYLPADRINERAFSLEMPLPFDGPLMPRPTEKRTGAIVFKATRKVLGITSKELASFLQENPRTVQKWEQARSSIDLAAWNLLQLAVRVPEVRRIMADSCR